jgi:uncharacterized repeat protein (TIGR03803 family)
MQSSSLFDTRVVSINLSLKSVIALLIMASASLVRAQTIQTLFSFTGTNGADPRAGLTLGNDGNFYGTTSDGFFISYGIDYSYGGTVFKMTTNGTLTTLDYFAVESYPVPSALTLGRDGNFYGTTIQGGSYFYGTVFKVTTNGTLTTPVSFNRSNGAYPSALTLGGDGNLYGTTQLGGSGGQSGGVSGGVGTVFKVTTSGTLTTLVSFNFTNGAFPLAALTLGNDGNFYGTTEDGGNTKLNDGYGYGTIFQVTANGKLTTLYSFTGGSDGSNPHAALTLGTDSNFYGTTDDGGSYDYGTIFQVTANGTLTTLVSFNESHSAQEAALTLGTDGNFYGTTYGGGSYNDGTIFKVTTNGTLTTLVSFNGSNGANSYATLILGNDGNLYGTTSQGGITNSTFTSGMGTVFRLLIPPVVPPTLALQFSAGCPQLNLTGTLGNNFVVQYSTNLADTNWINLLSLTNISASPYLFLDPAGVGQPVRFYRAFMQ